MLKLPKNYLSYSSFRSFNQSKTRRQWILRYIYKEPSFTTGEMAFGKRVSENLEIDNLFEIDDDLIEVLSQVQLDGIPEVELVLQQKGFYVRAFLDRCTLDYSHIIEYKTGKGVNPKGDFTGWDQERVNNHKQLDVYSWLIYENFGVLPKSTLIWMETVGSKSDVRFTGDIQKFERQVTKKEIQYIKKDFHKTALEMSKIYQLYLDGHDLYSDAKQARELIKEIV